MYKKKVIYLVRHGDKVKTPVDPPLSDLGNKQAQLTGKFLKSFPITRIFTSPILRAKQTAKHIADQLNIESETDELLRERSNWGDTPGQSFEEFLAVWEKATKERDWQPPAGDSSRRAGQRLEEIISKIAKGGNEHVVLVTHGGIITDFLRNSFTIEEINQHIDDFDSINIMECSITILEVDPKVSLKLIKLANTDHLENS